MIKIKKKWHFDIYYNMVDLENVLSETRQTEKDKYSVISPIWGT